LRTRAAQPLRGFSSSSIVITVCGGQSPDGRRIEATMSHDKISSAARKRMAQTGEPYAAARRAVVNEHQAAAGQVPPSDARCALRMSGEIHDWLTDLRSSEPPAAAQVGQALAALMSAGASLGAPLAVSPGDSRRPVDPRDALDRSYQQRLDRLQVVRRGAADAATLVKDIQDQVAELESAQAELEDLHRRALNAGRLQEAAEKAGQLAQAQQQAAEMRRLLRRRVRAGRAPEAAAHAYDDTPSFLQEIHPATPGAIGADSSSP
jgi:hypothetical protein